MRNTFAVVGVVVLGIAAFVGLLYGGLYLYSDYGPRRQAVEYEIFKNSPSNIQGVSKSIQRLKTEYDTTTDATTKSALKDQILREATGVDRSKLPADQQSFLTELERTQIELPKK